MRATTQIVFLSLLVATTSAVSLSGCGYTDNKTSSLYPSSSGTSGSGGTGGTGGSTVTFSEVNSQIFQPLCIQCHGSGASPDFSSYSSFATNTQWIAPGNPSGSTVYNEVASGAMPQGGPALSSDQLNLLSTWISEGAPND